MLDSDIQILRNLAASVAEIAHQPRMGDVRNLWTKKNGLGDVRPLVLLEEIPWNEMDVDGTLRTQVQDPFWNQIEQNMRRTLYKAKYIQDDMVVDSWIGIPRCIKSSGYGLDIDQTISVTDAESPIVGHIYHPRLRDLDDLSKLVEPVLSEDTVETAKREEEAHLVFDGLLDIHMQGYILSFSAWDHLAELIGVEQMLIDVADRPEFLHAAIDHLSTINEAIALQAEAKGFADCRYPKVHQTYTYNDFLPKPAPGEKTSLKSCWLHATAQIFGSISPRMHEELEFNYAPRLLRHFGAVNYGCCEPLHDRLYLVRRLPNVRKISCSPWCDMDIAAEQMGRDYVASNKPAPAFVGGPGMNWELIEADLRHTMDACKRNGTPLEFLLKDISTVQYQPQRLWEWSRRAMALALNA